MIDFSLMVAKRGFASCTLELSAANPQSITCLSASLHSCPRLPSVLPLLSDSCQSPMELWKMQLMMQLQVGNTGFTTFADPDVRPAVKQLIKLTPEGKQRKAIQDMLDVAEHPKGAAIRSLMRRRKLELSRLRRSEPPSMARARALDVLAVARER